MKLESPEVFLAV